MEPNENNVTSEVNNEQQPTTPQQNNNNQPVEQQEPEKQAPVDKQKNNQPDEQQKQDEEDKKPKKTKDLRKFLLKSSNLDWIAYDADKKILYVAFKSNTIYKYDDVPRDVFEGLRTAGSHGRYFAMRVKWKYKYERIK